ncbi:hypothetical protein FB451DRAFT_205024 [Mycena latifolia]|nr:hypothetical protein FB451DRAFT_205024 [Mycena latifolia]
MPPRKKQKTASASASTSTASSTAPALPASFPPRALLTRALAQYARALALRSDSKSKLKAPTNSKSKSNAQSLPALDAWLTTTLSAKVAAGEEITKDDMASLMSWKLARGKSRPALPALLASNPAPLVRSATAAALKTMRTEKGDLDAALRAVKELSVLKGVGAATASALLTLHPPHLLPFMSDEAAAFFAPALGPVKYTDAFYARFARAMGEAVGSLNADAATAMEGGSGSAKETDTDARWDAMTLERALFALAVLRRHGEEGILDAPSSGASGDAGDASTSAHAAEASTSAAGGSKRKRRRDGDDDGEES